MTNATSPYPWRTAAALIAAGSLTAPLTLPYAVALRADAAGTAPAPAVAWLAMGVPAVIRTLVLLAPATLLGLWVAPRIGLGAPYLRHRLDGGPAPERRFASIVLPALAWAAITAGIAFAIDAFFLHALGVRAPAPEIHARIHVAWWRSGLAGLWAPFAEEIFDRLFLMSLIAWLGVRIFRVSGPGRGRTIALWTANVATALFFGWYHISNEQIFAPAVPPLVALRTVLIVLPVGLAFGALYMRRGLEAAILSHFAIDAIVHVLRPIAEHGFR